MQKKGIKNSYYEKETPALATRFLHAFRGLRYAWQREPNFKIEILAALLVLGSMVVLPLSGTERAILILIVVFVLALEIVNSVHERILDLLYPHLSPEVKRIKDTMAGAVFLAALASLIIGGLILLRPFLAFDLSFQQMLSALRSPAVLAAARAATLLGGWQIILTLSALLGGALAFRRKYEFAGFLAGSVITGGILALLTKLLAERPRPLDAEMLGIWEGFSFPSGHVFVGTIFWLATGYILSKYFPSVLVWAASFSIIFFIGLSRVVLSLHWATDVVGGFLLGLFWVLLWHSINKGIIKYIITGADNRG